MKKRNKTLKRLFSGSLYVMLMILLAFSVTQLKVKREDDIAHLLGVGLVTVRHDDLLIVNMIDSDRKHQLDEGQMVIVYDLEHREFVERSIETSIIAESSLYYRVKGDADDDINQLIPAHDIIAIKQGHIAGAAPFYEYLQTPKGFALSILFPVTMFWIISMIVLVKTLLVFHRKNLEKTFVKHAEEKALEVEHEFSQIRQQLLKEFHLDN